MIAEIRAVWPGTVATVIIARDTADGREKLCFVFNPDGQYIAALCERACWNGKTQPPALVLTLEPKTRYGYKITDAELMPAQRNRATYIDQPTDDGEPCVLGADDLYPSLSDVQLRMDRVAGKRWKDI